MKRRFHLSLNYKEYISFTNKCKTLVDGTDLNDGKDHLDVIITYMNSLPEFRYSEKHILKLSYSELLWVKLRVSRKIESKIENLLKTANAKEIKEHRRNIMEQKLKVIK